MELPKKVSRDSEETDEKETCTSAWFLVNDFCDYTSAHGFGRIKAATHWTRTLFWSLLFIGAVAIMTAQVHTLFKKYQSRPLTTLVEVETSTSLPFPAVTFCNFNAIRNDSLQALIESGEMEYFRQLLEFAKNRSVNLRRRRSNDWDPSGTPSPTLESLTDDNYDDDDDDDWNDDDDDDDFDDEFEDPSKKEPSFLKSEQMAVLMARQDRRTLSLLGHRFEDMVLACTYRGVSCRNYTSELWKHYWHYKYGNCFVFNSGKTDSGLDAPVLKSNKPGPSHGLALELNVEQDEYVGLLTPEAGIRIDISTQGEMPFPMERGLSLAPGYATMIGLRKEKLIREDPFGSKRCLEDVSRDESNLYTKHFGAVYSAMACKESCLAYNQLERCGCMEYRFPGRDKRICNALDKATMKCIGRVQRLFKENELNCTNSCPPPCREEGFKTSSSFAIWPSEKHEPFYTASLEKENKFLLTRDGNHRKNVCKVQVFYEELNLEVITEQRSYELEDFVSDIGGQLGLWIGFSVLTVAEFLELFMLLLHVPLQKWRANRTSSSKQEPEQTI